MIPATTEPEGVMSDKGLRVHGLRVQARWATIASGIDLVVRPGEAVAIVGESGSGKSLTAKAVLDLLPEGVRAEGSVWYDGRDLGRLASRDRRRLRGSELALVMQDPFTMLNPVERVGDQITEPLKREGGGRLASGERRAIAVERLAEVGIADPTVADRYPFELSGGMRQRVGIASAIVQRPRVLIADEPTTALDVTTQREILDLLGELRRTRQMALVLITHDLRVAFSLCDRVHVMYAGTLVEVAAASDLSATPRHPYSLGLLLADPPVDRRVDKLVSIPGSVPAPGARPAGCPFAPRCEWALPECDADLPDLVQVADGHATRCRRVSEIGGELARRRRSAVVDAPQSEPEEHDVAERQLLVEVGALRKQFAGSGRGGAPTVALDDVHIQVGEGESVGLVGESGSGKTTLGRIVVGLERPTSGLVRVAGVELGARRPRARELEALRSTVQMAFQDPYSSLNPVRTVGATLAEASRLAGVDGDVGALLERVGLPAAYAKRRPSALSGGERQRVAIARALARKPRLVVCDEVVSALDVSVQAQILNLLRELRQELGLSYLFITHDLAVVRQVTDRLYVLRRGAIVEEGRTARVLDAPQHEYTQKLVASIPASADECVVS